jgi:hypothetical protein
MAFDLGIIFSPAAPMEENAKKLRLVIQEAAVSAAPGS